MKTKIRQLLCLASQEAQIRCGVSCTYVYWLFGVKRGGHYPKREEISFLDFWQSGYFFLVITVHRCAKKLDILAFLNSSDLYIYGKCLKKGGCYCKREETLVSNLQPSGYFWRVVTACGSTKMLEILAFLNSSGLYIYAKCIGIQQMQVQDY